MSPRLCVQHAYTRGSLVQRLLSLHTSRSHVVVIDAVQVLTGWW